MKILKTLTAVAALTGTLASVLAQEPKQPPAPQYYQTTNSVKVPVGKRTEFMQLMEVSRKVAESRVASGEIISWSLLRTVMPAGEEARADYLISTLAEGPPREPQARSATDALFKKAGVKMSAADFYAKRDSISTLVSTELWRPRARVGAPQKGHYMYLNYFKVADATEYGKFSLTVMRPIMEHWVKTGAMSGWTYGTKLVPSGSDTVYSAYTADIFPTWEAVFKTRSGSEGFKAAHPGKDQAQVMGAAEKTRSLARRELWVVVDRVGK